MNEASSRKKALMYRRRREREEAREKELAAQAAAKARLQAGVDSTTPGGGGGGGDGGARPRPKPHALLADSVPMDESDSLWELSSESGLSDSEDEASPLEPAPARPLAEKQDEPDLPEGESTDTDIWELSDTEDEADDG